MHTPFRTGRPASGSSGSGSGWTGRSTARTIWPLLLYVPLFHQTMHHAISRNVMHSVQTFLPRCDSLWPWELSAFSARLGAYARQWPNAGSDQLRPSPSSHNARDCLKVAPCIFRILCNPQDNLKNGWAEEQGFKESDRKRVTMVAFNTSGMKMCRQFTPGGVGGGSG